MSKNSIQPIIEKKLIDALRAGEAEIVSTFRMLKAELQNAEIAAGKALSDEEVRNIVAREVKKRKEAAELYEKGGEAERAGREKAEAELFKEFLPEQMSEEDVRVVVNSVIKKMSASSPADMGKVMGSVMAELKGKADGSLIKDVVAQALQGEYIKNITHV